ncbi:MAG: YfhO family protein [Firmicutes bacterium]|nr:YfhO family protein [Bacillota bacterium]
MYANPIRNKKAISYLLAFFLPVIFITAAFAAAGVYPFGRLSIVTSDLREQFLPLAAAISTKLKNSGNIFYSYSAGFGTDLFLWGISLLTDPLNILFLIFPIGTHQEVFLFTYIIKIGLAGLSACIYFNHSALMCDENGSLLPPYTAAALSVVYALCMHCIIYSLLITLMGNVIFFPLCLLALERLTDKKKPAAFAFMYFLCVMNSFYYAYFTGVCCFIYLVYYAAMRKINIKTAVFAVSILCFAAGVGICLSGAMTIPAAANVILSYSSASNTDGQTSLFFLNFKELMHGLLLISDTQAVYAKLDIFFGTAPLIFPLMLVLSKDIPKRERIATACTALFYFAALIFAPLYILMHFGRMPNSFNARFAFCMAFMFIIFTARAFILHEKINKKLLFVPVILLIIGLNAALSYQSSVRYLINSLVLIIFTLMYIAAAAAGQRTLKAVSLLMVCEAFLTCFNGISIIKDKDGYPQRQQWPDTIAAAQAPFEYTAQNDKGFYRQVNITEQSILAPLVTGYNSYTIFSSSANQLVNVFARNIGCLSPADHLLTNRYGTLVSDSILGVKYIVADDVSQKLTDINNKNTYTGVRGRINAYDSVKADDGYEIFKNPYAFPLMFAAQDSAINCTADFSDANTSIDAAYMNQQQFMDAVTGHNTQLYKRYDIGDAEFVNCEPDGDENTIYSPTLTKLSADAPYAVSGEETGVIHYSFPVEDDGEYCSTFYFDLNINDISNSMFMFFVDGVPADYNFTNPCIYCDLGSYKKGDVIDIQIMVRRSGIKMSKPTLLRLDTKTFAKEAEYIRLNAPADQCETEGIVTAQCNYKKDTLIFTTLAYNDGLDVLIDGKSAEKICAADAFLAFYVPAGSHGIEIKYTTPYLKAGILLSAITAALAAAFYLLKIIKGNKK